MDDLNFNIYNILIFSGIIQGIIFSIVILFNRKYKSKTNKYIAFTVLALSFSNLQYWFVDIGLYKFYEIQGRLHIPFDALIAPMFFLFVNSYLQKEYSRKLVYILCIPFIVSFIFNTIFFYKAFFDVFSFRVINAVLEIFSLLFNLVLIGAIIYKINIYEKQNVKYDKNKIRIKTIWLKQTLYIGGAICVFWLLEIIYVQSKNNIGLSKYYPLWICISALIYWISYLGIFQAKVYDERKEIRDSIISTGDIIIEHKKSTNTEFFDKICHWIKTNKSYLNPELNVSALAEEFKISNGYLSQLFSANTELNFNEFINKLRVEEVKTLLDNPEYDNYTILAIGLESGFNSKSSFYSAFKKFTGKTPNQYKK